MKWSSKIGRVAGIEVRIHATFLILLAWVAFGGVLAAGGAGGGAGSAFASTGLLLAVFAIVVLHELGHALVARRFGIRTRDIVLLPIGGVSRLERLPSDPREQLWVAVAGPLVNVVLAAVILAYVLAKHELGALGSWTMEGRGSIAGQLFWINVSLAAFNLLPAFPMDGGRALRALLATRMQDARATAIAARLGQAMALLLGAVGLFWNPLLVFIALFVWMGATQEESASELREAIEGIPVRSAMVTDLRTLAPDAPLEDAMRHVLEGFQQDFPVVEDGRVVGVLTRGDLMKSLSARGAREPVASAMRREFPTAEPSEPLSSAFERLRQDGIRTIPVLEGTRLVGVLTSENVGELVMFRTALRRDGRPDARVVERSA
jgi:Zn-dependent protease/predicted transcriptional regulator